MMTADRMTMPAMTIRPSNTTTKSDQDKVLDAVRKGEIVSLETALNMVKRKYKAPSSMCG